MSKPRTTLVFRVAFAQTLREFFMIPLWWYTNGLTTTFGRLLRSIKDSIRFFSVDVWAKNLFVPMYGDESITGRVISFGVRFVVLIVRSLGVVAWSFVAMLLALIYLVILPITLIGLITHLIGMFI